VTCKFDYKCDAWRELTYPSHDCCFEHNSSVKP